MFSQVLESSSENLLADDSECLTAALEACRDRGGARVDIVVDNAGAWRTVRQARQALGLRRAIEPFGFPKRALLPLMSHVQQNKNENRTRSKGDQPEILRSDASSPAPSKT